MMDTHTPFNDYERRAGHSHRRRHPTARYIPPPPPPPLPMTTPHTFSTPMLPPSSLSYYPSTPITVPYCVVRSTGIDPRLPVLGIAHRVPTPDVKDAVISELKMQNSKLKLEIDARDGGISELREQLAMAAVKVTSFEKAAMAGVPRGPTPSERAFDDLKLKFEQHKTESLQDVREHKQLMQTKDDTIIRVNALVTQLKERLSFMCTDYKKALCVMKVFKDRLGPSEVRVAVLESECAEKEVSSLQIKIKTLERKITSDLSNSANRERVHKMEITSLKEKLSNCHAVEKTKYEEIIQLKVDIERVVRTSEVATLADKDTIARLRTEIDVLNEGLLVSTKSEKLLRSTISEQLEHIHQVKGYWSADVLKLKEDGSILQYEIDTLKTEKSEMVDLMGEHKTIADASIVNFNAELDARDIREEEAGKVHDVMHHTIEKQKLIIKQMTLDAANTTRIAATLAAAGAARVHALQVKCIAAEKMVETVREAELACREQIGVATRIIGAGEGDLVTSVRALRAQHSEWHAEMTALRLRCEELQKIADSRKRAREASASPRRKKRRKLKKKPKVTLVRKALSCSACRADISGEATHYRLFSMDEPSEHACVHKLCDTCYAEARKIPKRIKRLRRCMAVCAVSGCMVGASTGLQYDSHGHLT